MGAKKTDGGAWINVNGNDKKGHVNIYNKDPKGEHDSIHINIDYDNKKFSITEKEDGEKTSTDASCFLTSACMKHFRENFDDNCYELTVLRWFRDNFVSEEDKTRYYKTAPIIVDAINREDKSDVIYDYIYDSVVDYCVEQIENGNYIEAYNRYKSSVLAFEEQFARTSLQNRFVKTLKLKTKN